MHLQNTEALRGRIARNLKLAGVQLLKLRVHPLLQRIGAQVLLNHQVSVTTGRQARQPGQQDLVQNLLAHANRRVRPDGVKTQFGVDRFGGSHGDVGQAENGGVAFGQANGAGVHVHRVHLCLRGEHRQSQGDGAPTAANVEHACTLRVGCFLQQNSGALINAGGAENAVSCGDGDLAAGKLHLHGAGLKFGLGGFREIMLLAHAIQCTGRARFHRTTGRVCAGWGSSLHALSAQATEPPTRCGQRR